MNLLKIILQNKCQISFTLPSTVEVNRAMLIIS